ncbi:hypothetical protein GY50_0641 [Dehalococcoides mccartyi GY50]|nr:hypothetical protein GY50_0641 [Dehalococcoides mccartyi GY50]
MGQYIITKQMKAIKLRKNDKEVKIYRYIILCLKQQRFEGKCEKRVW